MTLAVAATDDRRRDPQGPAQPSVMAFALLLTVGVVVLVLGYVAIQHASNPVANTACRWHAGDAPGHP